ncbi:MAG TPA: glycosyltransferase family 9 protein [Fimbriimonadaceae bacterium]|nr:glycosyltransferase family 9 protein [Fimbriimonadaceae bacterium]
MKRYTGEPIVPGARIAVVANDALGNFVIATPLLQMLRAAHTPASLDFFGGLRTAELQSASDLIDSARNLHGPPIAEALESVAEAGTYDLVVNLEAGPLAQVAAGMLAGCEGSVVGPCSGPGGRGTLASADDDRGRLAADPNWMRPDLLAAYPFLQSPWIGEIFCRVAYLEGPIPPYRLPSATPQGEIPEILIATAASGADKLWHGWSEALELLRMRSRSVGLLGAPPAAQRAFWQGDDLEERLVKEGLVHDLRGKFTLPEVVGALSLAKAVFTLDNGIMHLAAATPTPTVALFRPGIRRLWAPPSGTLHALEPAEGCPVSSIPIKDVLEALDAVL